MSTTPQFERLTKYLASVPGVDGRMGTGVSEDGSWWVKFAINIEHPLAWNVVQELGHVLNYLSLTERLPTVFKPVSPPPYINGGPQEFLSWVVECKDQGFTPDQCTEWLEGRLPRPVSEIKQWDCDDKA